MSTIEKLTQKEKELVAVAASIASGCVPCTRHHVQAVREAGASEAEVLGTISIALDIRDNATEIMAEIAHGNLKYQYSGKAQPGSIEESLGSLIAIGAALGCNSVADLEHHLTAARVAGTSSYQIQTAVGIARGIRNSAAEKADAVVESFMKPVQVKTENTEKDKESVPPPCDCGPA